MGRTGEERIGPYRVVERLGAGGMGEVFKAYDDRLDRWVAIKRIRPDKEQAEEHRIRFRREARAAAKLNHSAIVHIYDIFQDDESDCIVMELVEGESLDHVISEVGTVDPMRAADFGRQIASGLAEAHEKGILHRDLKTENIIITSSEQSKILDFGLAKPLIKGDLDSSLTGKGQVVGTSRAMSPEYVSGDEVDHRADLFSLGVLLYEMVTGQSPFKAHNTLATLKRVILHRQPPAAELNPAVPAELSHLIDMLLEKEPEDRPQSAREVAEALARTTGHTSSGAIDRPAGSTSAKILIGSNTPEAARRWRGLAISSLLLLLAATAIYLLWLRQPPTPGDVLSFQATEQIVIGRFDNRTGEEDLDALDSPFRVGLEGSRFANVLPQAQVRASLERMEADPDTPIDRELGIEIAQREGARGLVLGSIVKVGDAYSLAAEIVDPQTGRSLYPITATAQSRAEILGALDQLTQGIRANLGESLAGIEESSQPLAKVTTSNFEALRAYSAGSDQFDEGHDAEAIPLLLRAVQTDEGFAMAHAKLGTAYRNLGDVAGASRHFNIALQHTDRLTAFEELYVSGWVATWQKTPAEMIDAWGVMRTLFPERFEGHHNLAMVHWEHLNRFAEAERSMARAVEVSQGRQHLVALNNLGYLQLAQEHYEAARATFERLRATGEVMVEGLVETNLALGRDDQAKTQLDAILASSAGDQIVAGVTLAFYHLYRGNLDAASSAAQRVRTETEKDDHSYFSYVGKLIALAILERRHDPDFGATLRATVEDVRTLLGMDRLALDFSPLQLLAVLGKLCARNGDLATAEVIRAEIAPLAASDFPNRRANVKMLEGEILLARGRGEDAETALRESLVLVETLQGHESLARLAGSIGKRELAIQQWRWLADRPGRAFIECKDRCFGRALSLIDQVTAAYHLGLLYQLEDDPQQARRELMRFLDRWDAAQDLDLMIDARRRLEALVPDPAATP